jgi:hypothetical protein
MDVSGDAARTSSAAAEVVKLAAIASLAST